MTETRTEQADAIPRASTDVFAAARWLDELWNSRARAVGPHEIEWQCRTWGSGAGRGYWQETATFDVVAEAFGLRTWRNLDGRDELVVLVPLRQFAKIAGAIDGLRGDPELWPWLDDEISNDLDAQIALAADVLGMDAAMIAEREDLLDTMGIFLD